VKRRKSRFVLLLALMFAVGALLAGCGGGSGTSNASPTASASPPPSSGASDSGEASPTEEKHEPVKLKYTFWGSPQEKKAIEDATAQFTKKYPWITVEAVHIPEADYDTKVTAMVAGNEAPDAGYIHAEMGEAWQAEGKFLDLFELLRNDKEVKREDFLDYIWFLSNPNSAWGISTAGETFGLFYNKDLFDAAKLPYPPAKPEEAWTWDQFVDVAKKLTIDKNGRNASEPGFDPKNIKQFGVTFNNFYGTVMANVLNNNGSWVSSDGMAFTLDQPEATEAIQRIADLINVHHVMPSPLQSKSIPSSAVALQSKLAAMAMDGQWINLDLGAAKVNYDIGVLPKQQRSIAMGISGASAIFKSSKHPAEAWLLTKFLADPSASIDVYKGGLWMPTLKKWYTDPGLVAQWAENNPAHPSGFKDAFLNPLLNNSEPGPNYYIKNFGKINSLTFSALDPVWLGKQSAADALKALAPKITPELKGRYDNE